MNLNQFTKELLCNFVMLVKMIKKHWINLLNIQKRKPIRSGNFDIGIKNKFQSDFCYFIYLRNHIKTSYVGNGGGLRKRSDRP